MSRVGHDRLVMFSDVNSTMAGIALAAFVKELRGRNDIRLVAVCDTARRAPGRPWLGPVQWLRYLARRGFNPSLGGYQAPISEKSLHGAARRGGVPLIVPPGRNVNHPDFIARLRDGLRPTLALSVSCLQIFGKPLLDVFEMAVNLHDGALPYYKGLGATAWSLYQRESHTGYTFHRMDAGIDTGAVLVQGQVPVLGGESAPEVRIEKMRRAAGAAGQVLDLMAARAEGTPQEGEGSYCSAAERKRLCTIADPAELNAEEIRHRLRCFEILEMPLGGMLCEVTALGEEGGRYSFTSGDGVRLAARRMLWLPPWMYRWYRRVKGHGR